jgi:hypothetical protein
MRNECCGRSTGRDHGRSRVYRPAWIAAAMVAFVVFAPRLVSACSPAPYHDPIGENVRVAYRYAAVTVASAAAVLILAWRIRRRLLPMISVGLVLLQPAWTISAISGDCGMTRREGAEIFMWAALAVLVVQIFRWLRPKRRSFE